MSSIETRTGQAVATVILVGSSEGGTETTQPGANAGQGVPETLHLKETTPSVVELNKTDGDDLTQLATLLGQTTLGGFSATDSDKAQGDEPTSLTDSEHTPPALDEGCGISKAVADVSPGPGPNALQQEGQTAALPTTTTHSHKQSREPPSLRADKSSPSQSTPTSSGPKLEAPAGQSPSENGGVNPTPSDAHTERDSEPLIAKEGDPVLHGRNKEKEGENCKSHHTKQIDDPRLRDSSIGSDKVEGDESKSELPFSTPARDEGYNKVNTDAGPSLNSLQQGDQKEALLTNSHEQSAPPADKSNTSPSTPVSSVPGLRISVNQPPPGSEGTGGTLSDTHTDRGDSAPSTPKEGAPVLPKLIKKEGDDDDPLADLSNQLAGTTLADTDDTSRGVKPERGGNGSARPSPPKLDPGNKGQTKLEYEPDTPNSKALDNYYYFCTLTGLYYFDNYHNVFFHDGTLVHDGLDSPDWDDLLTPHFCLDGISFWFDSEGLLYRGIDGNLYRAEVWKVEQQSDQPDHSQASDGSQAPQDDPNQTCIDPKLTLPTMSGSVGLSKGGQLDQSQVAVGSQAHQSDAAIFEGDLSYQSQYNSLEFVAATMLALDPSGGAPEARSIERREGADTVSTSGGANSDEGARTVKRKHVENEQLEAYPTEAAAINSKYCFYASGRLFYFDSNRKLYSKDGKLAYDGSSSFTTNQRLLPNFHIDEVPYWFEKDKLSARGADGVRYPVHTWLSKQESLDQYLSPEQRPISKNHKVKMTTKADTCSPKVTSNTLQLTLRGNPNIRLSPLFNSANTTPNTPPINGDHPVSHGPSLFRASEPGIIQRLSVDPQSEDDILLPVVTTERAQPGKKQRGDGHRTCPFCFKVMRRPCALREHINSHIGAKPHVCPFVDCNTGFATRQNMRRHFTTHRVGEIDDYQPGMTQGSARNKRRKVAAETFPVSCNGAYFGRVRL
ncbi:unnamed protein product [Rhizoctonia solani]|uniref:C2H2-type domain-containing protein n=1 Tax=Rhizoctonia solani TaxID=456999 RepID=A0A8H3D4V0_9AGAM|nr:unnamed protein product [Rhizoctonia solani]